MKIKICCDDLKYYIDKAYIKCDEKSYDVDTPIYINCFIEKVEIWYCPFCAKEIKKDIKLEK